MDYAGPSKHSANSRIDFNAYPENIRHSKSVTNQGNNRKVDIMTNTPNVSFTTSLFTTYNMNLDKNLNDSKQLNASKVKKVFERQTETNAKEMKRGESANNAKPTRVRNKMYHCEFCDICTMQKKRTGLKCDNDEVHYNGKCVWIPSTFCSLCGLKFTDDMYQGHRASHRKYKLELHLHKFYRWQDEKPLLKTPVPRYPYCNKCKVYYLPLKNKEHDHSQSKVKCNVCKKIYDGFTYELHMNFHKTNKPSKDDINLDREAGEPLIDKSENISIGAQGETVIEFFRCKICAATYHVKGYVARHKCDTPLRHCKQCNMLITAPHYKKHSELHDRYNNDTNCRGTITEFENYNQPSTSK